MLLGGEMLQKHKMIHSCLVIQYNGCINSESGCYCVARIKPYCKLVAMVTRNDGRNVKLNGDISGDDTYGVFKREGN